MYIFGGFNGERFCDSDIHIFDFDKKKWVSIKGTGAVPSGRSRSKMIYYHNKIAVIGGWNKTKYYNDWFEFSLEDHTWIRKDVLFPSEGFGQNSVIVRNNCLYMFGGYDSKNKKANNQLWGYYLGHPTAS